MKWYIKCATPVWRFDFDRGFVFSHTTFPFYWSTLWPRVTECALWDYTAFHLLPLDSLAAMQYTTGHTFEISRNLSYYYVSPYFGSISGGVGSLIAKCIIIDPRFHDPQESPRKSSRSSRSTRFAHVWRRAGAMSTCFV